MWQVVSGIRDPFEGDCDLRVVTRILQESWEEGIASTILAERLRDVALARHRPTTRR